MITVVPRLIFVIAYQPQIFSAAAVYERAWQRKQKFEYMSDICGTYSLQLLKKSFSHINLTSKNIGKIFPETVIIINAYADYYCKFNKENAVFPKRMECNAVFGDHLDSIGIAEVGLWLLPEPAVADKTFPVCIYKICQRVEKKNCSYDLVFKRI